MRKTKERRNGWEIVAMRHGILLIGLVAVALAPVLLAGRASADELTADEFTTESNSAHFKDSNLKGNYLCNLDGDDNFENSVIKVSADGSGNLSAKKVHVSTDFEGTGCGGLPCVCSFTGTATTTVNSDGTGLTNWLWTPVGGNPTPCPSAQHDTWAYALGSRGKSFFVASANSGFEREPATGGCSTAP